MVGRQQGFTLMEILVAIIVLGVLGALVLPTYLGAQKRPYDAAALECGRAIIEGQEMYKVARTTYLGGPYTGLSTDVTLRCQGLQVHPFVNGFTPTATATGNGNVLADRGGYAFWVWHQQGSAAYYTSTWNNNRLEELASW